MAQKKYFQVLLIFLLLALTSFDLLSQIPQIRIDLNEEKTNYVRFTGLGQIWLRNTNMNPGSTINDFSEDNYTDLSIRRWRFQVIAQLTDNIFFYSQFGQNNFNFHSTKFEGFFLHDAVVQYDLSNTNLSFGGGLTSWTGPSRYSSPSIGSIMSLDAPLYQQSTGSITDQFIRKLSVYAKGQVGKLDYRVIISQPFTIPDAAISPSFPQSSDFNFANTPPSKQFSTYLKYMFADSEGNLTPYQTGTYLGSKKIINLGGGILFQPDAMWAQGDNSTVEFRDLLLASADVFIDYPINEKQVLTWYLAYSYYDYGDNYIRYVGVDNPATGSTTNTSNFGNAFPLIGTGNIVYSQLGYLKGKIQPFATSQISFLDKLDDPMLMYEVGVNYLISGHNGKISLEYQGRPYFEEENGSWNETQRKGMIVCQYQISF